jgi:triacylglycerol lipase
MQHQRKTPSHREDGAEVQPFLPHGEVPYASPILSESLFVLENTALWLSPVYYGGNIPKGDGSGVVIIPGLLGFDVYLCELYGWLRRIGYRPYYSGMVLAADCPNRLMGQLDATIERAYQETGRRVHLIGHSLGGIFARVAAVQRPRQVASVITLGTPFRGLVAHRLVLALSDTLRGWIRSKANLSRECGTSRCGCKFGRSLSRRWPRSVRQTAVYTKCDGIVDWRYCLTGKPKTDIEVVGTHVGLPFNEGVLSHIATRLAAATQKAKGRR